MDRPAPSDAAPAGRSKPAAARSSTPPKTLGRYQVLKLLGEGAMGRVYQATDPELGRDVAIKVLRLDAAGNARDAYIARFRNEARAAARFSHPNVVILFDAGVDPVAGPYLVYEFIAGHTLRGRLAQGRLPPNELVSLARGLASALDALHAAGILHRDVKPDNILLTPDGGVKLTDMGIARVPDAALTREGQFLGTPAYAAPEAITRGEYTPRGDVFSLGAVLYEALCGVRPFPGEDAVSVSYSVAHDTPLAPSRHVPELPPAVDAAFARALAKKNGERFASTGELAGALYAAFRSAQKSAAGTTVGESVVPEPPRPSKRPQHPARPDKAGSAPAQEQPLQKPAIILAVVLLVLAVVLARRFAGPEEPTAPAPPAQSVSEPGAPAPPPAPPASPRSPRTRTPRSGAAH